MVGQSWKCAWKVNAGSDYVIIYELITHTYIYISFNLLYAFSLLQTKKLSVQP